MNVARLLFVLILVVTSGCLAGPYPGIVVGNPEVDEGTTAPGKPNENPEDLFPGNTAHEPFPSEPPTSGGDPSTPGSVDKEPDEPDTADADQEIPGGDRVGQEPDEVPPPTPSRPEYAQPYEELPDTVMMVQEN